MSEHGTPTAERHCDVAIIGGSATGLAAALQLGRQRRSVIVVDAGEPRNAPAAHMHGYLGHEGLPPAELIAIAREEVRSYGGEVLAGRAVEVSGDVEGGFRVVLDGGSTLIARRVLAATGMVDELPDIEGLAEHWGVDVIHCPFCHGYEVRDRRVVQILTHPMGLHPAGLFRQLTDQLTLVLHDGVAVDHDELAPLRAAGVDVVDTRVRRILTGADRRVSAVELVDGVQIEADAVVVGGAFRVRDDALTSLEVAMVAHPSGLGDVVDARESGETSVPGLYAAGNLVDPSQQVLQAAAQGSWVGAMISFGLARDDIDAASRPSSNQADWEARYGSGRMWSGNPNGTLVREITEVTPGRALDVGAGEGGDAVWLAERGWQVTATDISQHALDGLGAVAADQGLTIDCLHADANALEPFPVGAFDLVTAHYASIPRTPDGRGIANLLAAVAPGGTLLIVSHDVEPMRVHFGPDATGRPFDPDGYVRTDDVLAMLSESADWDIEVHETRDRPGGHAAASHHVEDVVVRVRRGP